MENQSSEPRPPDAPGNATPKKPSLLPWLATLFVPTIGFLLFMFTAPQELTRKLQPQTMFLATYCFGAIVTLVFFRTRVREPIQLASIYAFIGGFVVIVLNVILFVSIAFVGCLCKTAGL